MKQSQEIAIATQYQERANTAIEIHVGRQQNEIVSRRIGQGLIDRFGLPSSFDEDTSAEEFGIVISDARTIVLMYDNLHFQYENGFLSEESWQGHENALCDLVNRPKYLYIFENMGQNFRPSFINLCK